MLVAYTDYAVNNEAEIRIRSTVYADLLDRLRAVPGVTAAAGIAFLPMGREPRPARDYFIQGQPEGQPGDRAQAELYAITPDYFKTLEIPLRVGRDFDRTDTPERPPVAIINETLTRAGFQGESPLGQHIRTNSNANPTVPVRFETMQELFDFALAYPRFRTQVIGLFAGVSALLAAVGIFSVLAYLVGQRRRELAIRRAPGARATDVIRLIVGQGLGLVAIGLVLGLAGALGVARLLTGLLYEIGPWDVGTYLGTIAMLGGAALVATLLPAIRAATIAPLIVLRQE